MADQDLNTNIAPLGDIDLSRYEKIPMDLNFSPLREYFEGIYQHKAEPVETSLITGKTQPVGIPGSAEEMSHHARKRRHHKSRRKPFAHTLPDDGLELSMERKLLRQNDNKAKTCNRGQQFTVGSLKDTPPVPWPTALVTTADSKLRHSLKNRQTVNWPLLPHHHYQEDQDDIFDMDDDIFSGSDSEDNLF